MELIPVAVVESPLTDLVAAPKQGDEGAPEATLVFEVGFVPALDGIAVGDELLVLTWLDRASREVLRVHPRGDALRAEQGVFAARSPEPDRAAPRNGPRDRRSADARQRSRSARRHAGARRQAGAAGGRGALAGNSYRVGRLYPR